jgi:hypothetical protein
MAKLARLVGVGLFANDQGYITQNERLLAHSLEVPEFIDDRPPNLKYRHLKCRR